MGITRETIREAVFDCLREMNDRAGKKMTDTPTEASLLSDLGIDSLNLLHLFVALQERLHQPLSVSGFFFDGHVHVNVTIAEVIEKIVSSLGVHAQTTSASGR